MADFKNIKKSRNSLGKPPSPAETKGNLDAPEVAPAAPIEKKVKKPVKENSTPGRPATGRTAQLTTMLNPDIKKGYENDCTRRGKRCQ